MHQLAFPSARWMALGAIALASSASPARARQCTPGLCNSSYTPYVYFSHDSYGCTAVSAGPKHSIVKGPSHPCHTMKAVSEGGAAFRYQGVRTSNTALYSRTAVHHEHTLEVEYAVIDHLLNPFENNATQGVLGAPQDFLLRWPDCPPPTPPPTYLITNDKFQILAQDWPNCCCSDAGALMIEVSSGALDQGEWEAPEVAKVRMDSAVCTLDPSFNVEIGTESYVGAWVIQDECETGALFRYPEPLPPLDSKIGLTVQLATSLGSIGGAIYRPDFNFVGMGGHVGQNYPFAASEVVSEDSWLEFAIVLVDQDGAHVDQQTGVQTNDIGGVAVYPPYDLLVTLDVLDQDDWSTPSGCSGWTGGAWGHYATESVDFLLQEWDEDPSSPTYHSWVSVNQVGELYTLTIDTTQKLRQLRFFAITNDSGPDLNESHEVAHVHVSAVSFANPPGPPQHVPHVDVGWSSDFRFVVQEDGHCP